MGKTTPRRGAAKVTGPTAEREQPEREYRGFRAVGVGIKRNNSITGDDPRLAIQRRLEDCSKAVIIGLRYRVVAMVVTLGTAHRQTQ